MTTPIKSCSSSSDRPYTAQGYDIIEDVHGCASQLTDLLKRLVTKPKAAAPFATQSDERSSSSTSPTADRNTRRFQKWSAGWLMTVALSS